MCYFVTLHIFKQAILPIFVISLVRGWGNVSPGPHSHFSALIHHSITQTGVVSDGVECVQQHPQQEPHWQTATTASPSASIYHLFVCSFPHCSNLNLMSPLSLSTQEAGLTNGTPVETSSPASASSLFNRLQLDDDLEADVRDLYASTETRDLFVTVDDPKKHVSTMETYITYRVSTKVCYWQVPC